MKKITLSVLLALVAFASAAVPAKNVDMTVVIDLLGKTSKVEPNTIDKVLNIKKLTKLERADPKLAQLARLFERISKIDWEGAYIFFVENQFTFNNKLNVDGEKVDIKYIFKLLARIGEVNWTELSKSFVDIKSLKMVDGPKDEQLDMVRLKERTESLVRLRHRLKLAAASKRNRR